jgi:hypothetical protein
MAQRNQVGYHTHRGRKEYAPVDVTQQKQEMQK